MRVELTSVAGLAPETSAYTNSATSAFEKHNTLIIEEFEDYFPYLLILFRCFNKVHL